MPAAAGHIPKLCVHEATGRAYVRIDGKQIYLGRAGSDEARRKYDRAIARWLGRGRASVRADTPDLTVGELVERFRLEHPDRKGLWPLRSLQDESGEVPASGYGPVRMAALVASWD